MTYKCKYCNGVDHLQQVTVKRWTVWFRCLNETCTGKWIEQSFNRELYQQSPAKLNQERFA